MNQLIQTCISSPRENSLRVHIMTCGLTDEEMIVNSTAKENDALQTLYPTACGSLPILLYTQGNRPSQSSKSYLPNPSFKNKL